MAVQKAVTEAVVSSAGLLRGPGAQSLGTAGRPPLVRHVVFVRRPIDAPSVAASVDTSKPATTWTVKTGHQGVGPRLDSVLRRGVLVAQVGLALGAPAPQAALEDVGVVEKAVEESGDSGGVSEELAPVVHRAI